MDKRSTDGQFLVIRTSKLAVQGFFLLLFVLYGGSSIQAAQSANLATSQASLLSDIRFLPPPVGSCQQLHPGLNGNIDLDLSDADSGVTKKTSFKKAKRLNKSDSSGNVLILGGSEAFPL